MRDRALNCAIENVIRDRFIDTLILVRRVDYHYRDNYESVIRLPVSRIPVSLRAVRDRSSIVGSEAIGQSWTIRSWADCYFCDGNLFGSDTPRWRINIPQMTGKTHASIGA